MRYASFCSAALPLYLRERLSVLLLQKQAKTYALLDCIAEFIQTAQEVQSNIPIQSYGLLLPLDTLATFYRSKASLLATEPHSLVVGVYSARDIYSIQIVVRLLNIRHVLRLMEEYRSIVQSMEKLLPYEGVLEGGEDRFIRKGRSSIMRLRREVNKIIGYYICEVVFLEDGVRKQPQMQSVVRVIKENVRDQEEFNNVMRGIKIMQSNGVSAAPPNEENMQQGIDTMIEEQRQMQQKEQNEQEYNRQEREQKEYNEQEYNRQGREQNEEGIHLNEGSMNNVNSINMNSSHPPTPQNKSYYQRRCQIPQNYQRFLFNRTTFNWRPYTKRNIPKKTRVIYDADNSSSRNN